MREETVTYKVFKFSELDSKVQEKVLDKHRHWNVEHFEWWDSVYDMKQEDLAALGFNDIKIWFSGFASQGDGACFDCNSFDIPKLIQALENKVNPEIFKKYKKYITKLDNAGMLGISIETIGHHYSHEHTRNLTVDFNAYSNCKRLNALVDEFQKDLEELRTDLSREIYKCLESEYEYLTSDEAVRESLEANDVEFLENGKTY